MPKVLRIINRFNLGGPTYNVAYLSKYLSSDYETLLVGGEKDETEDSSEHILEKLNLKASIVPEMKREIDLKNDWIAYKKIKKIIKEYKPDIVHTHASKAGTIGRLAAASCGVPIIVHTFHGHVFHSYFGKLKTEFYKNIERFLARKSTAIIAISDIQKQELSQTYKICKSDKIKVIPLGFDLNRFNENKEEKRKQFREKFQLKDDEIAIGIIGRFVPIKNHPLFLKAFANIKQHTQQKIKAVLIGDGESRLEIENTCKELNLSYNKSLNDFNTDVVFTSWIKDIDVANAGLDIIALSSFNEGTPVSLIEAQASSKPIVSTNVGGIENVVIPNKTALLSASNDLNGFTANLLQLVENAELRTEMSKLGWNHVKENYHYTRLVKDMENFYNELLKPKKAI